MEHADFRIGLEFKCGGGIFRCTDVGTRTIAAIRIDQMQQAINDNSEVTHRTVDRAHAEAECWFKGPPYAVAEFVFDEDDVEGCLFLDEEE